MNGVRDNGFCEVYPNGLPDDDARKGTLQFTRKDVLKPEWFWQPWIAKNVYTLVIGQSSAGKSTFGAFLASMARRSIILPGEESIKHCCLKRCIKNSVDLRKVRWIPASEHWLFPRDTDKLIRLVEQDGADFLLVDPIDSYLEDGYDEDKNIPMRRFLDTFSKTAEATGAAIVCVRHPGKDPRNLIAGSRAFRNHPRAVLQLTADPLTKDKGILEPYKPPLGIRTPPHLYDLEGKQGEPRRFVLGGLAPAHQALEATEVGDRLLLKKIDQAADLLKHLLDGGTPMDGKEIYARAKEEQISDTTLYRAGERLGVKVQRKGTRQATKTVWWLPQGGAEKTEKTERT